MLLRQKEYIEITRHLQMHLKKVDPEVFELLARHVEPSQDARYYLLNYLASLLHVTSERSSGAHGRILNLLNLAY